MISTKFLKLLGCTKADLTNFVRTPPLAREKTKLYEAIRAYKGDVMGDVLEASSCCGVCELASLDNEDRENIHKTVLSAIAEGWKFLIYYSVNANTTKVFKEIGFEAVNSFRNPNTGNTVTVLTLKV